MNEEWPPWLVWLTQNPVLQDVTQEILANPAFAERTAGIFGRDGRPVYFQDWDQVRQIPGANPSRNAIGATVFNVQPDSTVGAASIGIDVDRLHRIARQDSAKARDMVRDAVIHEFAHLIPVAESGHIRDRLLDPQSENVMRHPLMRQENELRGLLGLPARTTYELKR